MALWIESLFQFLLSFLFFPHTVFPWHILNNEISNAFFLNSKLTNTIYNNWKVKVMCHNPVGHWGIFDWMVRVVILYLVGNALRKIEVTTWLEISPSVDGATNVSCKKINNPTPFDKKKKLKKGCLGYDSKLYQKEKLQPLNSGKYDITLQFTLARSGSTC